MHTITNCSRCGNDFMYHNSDSHLYRTVAFDADTKEPCSFEVVCQDCDYVEKDIEALQKDFQFSNYESYKEVEKYHGTQNLWSCGLMTIDKEEYNQEGRLTYQSLRLLTEEEFNKRVLPFIK